jgi:hypothetical protein
VEPHFGQNLTANLAFRCFSVFRGLPANMRHLPFRFTDFLSSLFFGSLGFFTRFASVTAKN